MELRPINDDFFHFVRLLERRRRHEHGTAGGSAPVGGDGPPSREAVRFHSVNHLAFPARALERVKQPEDDERTHLDLAFLGLTGPSGVLPRHYSMLVQERQKQKDTALADFLDMFNHRLASLYYRAWAKYRPAVQHEDRGPDGSKDVFTRALQALAGQHARHDHEARLYYAGHFARHSRPVISLQTLLRDHVGHPVRVESFAGQWLPISPRDRLQIGSGRRGRNNRLGDGVLPGRRTWDMQSKFRVVIGPLTHAEHEQLLPDQPRFQSLKRLVEEYAPSHLNVEIQYLIRDDARNRRPLGQGLRTGWNTWLQSNDGKTRQARLPMPRTTVAYSTTELHRSGPQAAPRPALTY